MFQSTFSNSDYWNMSPSTDASTFSDIPLKEDQWSWYLDQVNQWPCATHLSGVYTTSTNMSLNAAPRSVPTPLPDNSGWAFMPGVLGRDSSNISGYINSDINRTRAAPSVSASSFCDSIDTYSDLESMYVESPFDYLDTPSYSRDLIDQAKRTETISTAMHSYLQVDHGRSPSPQSTYATNSTTTEVDALMQSLGTSYATQTMAKLQDPQDNRLKKYRCFLPSCSKSFSQPTHLKIHIRSHTGEKPYACSFADCDAAFSQLGNLRTHERRHRGEKPHRRSRAVSDPSNADAHTYECVLDHCRVGGNGSKQGRVFTQLGNLKAHMNKFHKETLAKLNAQFANVDDDDSLTTEERELRDYFRTLYRNCNKGIKGRGKGRKVAVIV